MQMPADEKLSDLYVLRAFGAKLRHNPREYFPLRIEGQRSMAMSSPVPFSAVS